MNPHRFKYVVITPARDEEEFIAHTLESMVSQTIRPKEWILVNDGSSDRTGIIIDGYVSQYEWIRSIHRENRGYRKNGSGVMDAFYDGYNCLNCSDWDFLVKLDGDLSFDSRYFEECSKKFKENQRLGIGGGTLLNLVDWELKPEAHPFFHVRGATKIYRRDCWVSIGGLIQAPGWDTVDEVKANMLGWETCTFKDVMVVHHRPTGLADGVWRNAVKSGRANYISGYHPLFMLAKCAKRFGNKKYSDALGHMYGFLRSYCDGTSQVFDKELIWYLRKEQMKRLFFMKTIWK